MENKKLNLALIRYVLIIFLVTVFNFSFLFCNADAKMKNLIDNLDYSTLSVEEIQQEVALLYTYGKKAFAENDLELAKLFFYQILELDVEHPGANKYIDYYIPKKFYQAKIKQFKKDEQAIDLDTHFEKEKQTSDLDVEFEEMLKEEKVPSETKKKIVQKEVKEKVKEKPVAKVVTKEKTKQKPEPKESEATITETEKLDSQQRKQQARIEKEKRMAEERKAEIMSAAEKAKVKRRQKELMQIVEDEKKKRKLEIAQRKRYEAEKKKQEAIQKKEAESMGKVIPVSESPETKEVLTKVVQEIKQPELRIEEKSPPKAKPLSDKKVETKEQPKIIKQVVQKEVKKTPEEIRKQEEIAKKEKLEKERLEKELTLIQDEQKRVAKEEEIRKRALEIRERNKYGIRSRNAEERDALPLAKLSKQVKKVVVEPKPVEIVEVKSDLKKKEVDLEKYLLEQKKIAEMRVKGSGLAPAVKEESAETGAEVVEAKGPQEINKEALTAEYLDNSENLFQEGNWDKIKSMYKEGIYSYRAGEYDSAQKSFNQILQQN